MNLNNYFNRQEKIVCKIRLKTLNINNFWIQVQYNKRKILVWQKCINIRKKVILIILMMGKVKFKISVVGNGDNINDYYVYYFF